MHLSSTEIRTEGVLCGGIQVPGNGEPVILGPDQPVTGGYPKIAQVIQADLGKLAYLLPGDSVRFRLVTLQEAREAVREREEDFRFLTAG
jgi:allophanate hydrolase subunit 2